MQTHTLLRSSSLPLPTWCWQPISCFITSFNWQTSCSFLLGWGLYHPLAQMHTQTHTHICKRSQENSCIWKFWINTHTHTKYTHNGNCFPADMGPRWLSCRLVVSDTLFKHTHTHHMEPLISHLHFGLNWIQRKEKTHTETWFNSLFV